MAKKSPKAKKSKPAKKGVPKSKCLVIYVENSSPKSKIFETEKSAWNFIDKYKDDHPDVRDGWWVEYLVTNIKGEVYYLDLNNSSEEE